MTAREGADNLVFDREHLTMLALSGRAMRIIAQGSLRSWRMDNVTSSFDVLCDMVPDTFAIIS